MKTIKIKAPAPKLTGAQIVQKKLDEMNAMLKNIDLSKLPVRQNTKQN